MLAPPEVAFARHDGVHLAYQVAGTGPPDIVFVAGAMSVSLAWDEALSSRGLRRLASFARLVTFDQRGMGLSDRVAPDATLSMDDLVADLAAVVEASGCGEPVLFGTHNGGAVASLYASRYPVRQLVLCNTWARLAAADDYEFGFPERVLDRMQQRYETEWGKGRIIADYGDRGSHSDSKRIELGATHNNQHGPLFGLNRSFDVRAVLPRIEVPTLVIHTAENFMVPPAFGRYVAESIPGARLVLLPGSDHAFLRTNADAVIDEVEHFVTGRLTAFSDRLRMAMVFTDIVDSTPLAAELGDDAWNALIEEHNVRMLCLVEEMGGHGIKSTGDGYLAAFGEAPAAVRCARSALEAMSDLGIRLRAGVHLGEASRMGNRDVSGLAVHFAQRLCARAEGGQVLVSEDVRSACDGVDPGITFVGRGKAQLKGIPGEWELFEAALPA